MVGVMGRLYDGLNLAVPESLANNLTSRSEKGLFYSRPPRYFASAELVERGLENMAGWVRGRSSVAVIALGDKSKRTLLRPFWGMIDLPDEDDYSESKKGKITVAEYYPIVSRQCGKDDSKVHVTLRLKRRIDLKDGHQIPVLKASFEVFPDGTINCSYEPRGLLPFVRDAVQFLNDDSAGHPPRPSPANPNLQLEKLLPPEWIFPQIAEGSFSLRR
jgi:hypothetical protein